MAARDPGCSPTEADPSHQAIPTAFHSSMDLMMGGIIPPKSARAIEMYLPDRFSQEQEATIREASPAHAKYPAPSRPSRRVVRKHICGTRVPEPLYGSMDKNEAEKPGGSTGRPNAHLRTPGPSPHRRSGRAEKADRADHGIRSRANIRRARTGALICPGRSHCRFGNKGATGRANVVTGRADGQFSDSTATLFQIK